MFPEYSKFVESIAGKPWVHVFKNGNGQKFCLDQEKCVLDKSFFPGNLVELVQGVDGITHVISPRLPHYRTWRDVETIRASIHSVDVANHGANADPSIPYAISAKKLYDQIPQSEWDLVAQGVQ
jgi:hypothetical protein